MAGIMALSAAIQIAPKDLKPQDVANKDFVLFFNKNFDLNGDGVISPEELELFRTEMASMEGMTPREKLDAFSRYGSEDGEPVWFTDTLALIDSHVNPFKGGVRFENFSEVMRMVGLESQEIEDAWEWGDENGDGLLDIAEAGQMWSNWQNFQEALPTEYACEGDDCMAQT